MTKIAEQPGTGAFLSQLQEHMNLFGRLGPIAAAVNRTADAIATALSAGGKLMLCGNGGSAADCQHIAAEFVGRFVSDRRPLAAIALSTDTSALTAIGNDYTFADVFSRQVLALGKPGDCLLGISTSGNSRNVIRAVQAARSLDVRTLALLGRDGGELRTLCELSLVVPAETTARIQEAHIFLGHVLCGMIESRLGLA